ncbi:MAG: hypothetical protein AAF799_12025 [Myxococcota bacterium]
MKRIAHATAVLAVLSTQVGWDTQTVGPANNQWESLYIFPPETSSPGDRFYLGIPQEPSLVTGNEHTELSHIAIQQLGWTQLYGELPAVIDLNESVYRRHQLQVPVSPGFSDAYGDVTDTGLTERAIPHPARFSGTADYSYTVADWLNKNQFCPALPEGVPQRDECHTFEYWLGAVFNSSHFGDQATAVYKHYHRIAMALARNAQFMGAQLEAAIDQGRADQTELEAYVREAELEALIYEGYAQHYLQDRWSSGHMWNRWNAPSYEAQEAPIREEAELSPHRVTGLVSGMIHGGEAKLKNLALAGVGLPRELVADPMCSPVIGKDAQGNDAALGVDHVDRVCADSGANLASCTDPGVGDYRLRDMMRSQFGASYYGQDYPLDVDGQRTEMLACSTAGWADVASQFHDDGSGRYGTFDLTLPSGTARFTDSSLDEVQVGGARVRCWDQWATNTAMSQGRALRVVLGAAYLGRVVVRFGPRFSRLLKLVKGQDLVHLYEQMILARNRDPNGTTLARNWQPDPPGPFVSNNYGLLSLQGSKPGGEYVDAIPAAYHEPVDGGTSTPFDELPDQSDAYGTAWSHTEERTEEAARPGLDKHTIYGFFNKAHSHYWCAEAGNKLPWNDEVDLFLTGDDDERTHPRQGMRMPVPRPEEAKEQGETLRRLDACVLMADRLYQGTRAFYMPEGEREYLGESAESRRVEHGGVGRPEVDAPCSVFADVEFPGWEDNPRDLHPGYVVATDPEDADSGPYLQRERYDHAYYESIANWCRALPVVNVDTNDMAVDESGVSLNVRPGITESGEVSFADSVLNPHVTLRGYNFGDIEGRVRLDSINGCVDVVNVSPLADIVSWSDREITISVDNTRFIPDLYDITIIRDDRNEDGGRVRSVGRARLDISVAVFTDVASPGAPLPPASSNQPFRAIHPYCDGGVPFRHEIWDCTELATTQLVDCGDDQVGAGTRLWNDEGPFDPQPGPWDEHTWTVDQVGTCEDMFFPSAACPDHVPAYYGLTYRFDRLSNDPITATDRTWRFVLGWARPGL